MKVSLNWVKEFTQLEMPVAELVEKIGAQLGAVEEVIDFGKRYEGIVVVEVLSCEKHPDADKLTVCIVDDRGVVTGVDRESDGHLQIVCGAPNVKEGMLVAWIPPGVVVPATAEKEPFKIEAKEIRGVVSNGMLASAKELALGDSHEGLLVIDEGSEPGQLFAEVYGLNDHVVDIENKMFTHRPDCFGMLGVARELAGITGQTFKGPDWYNQEAKICQPEGEELKFEVKNEVSELVPRFSVVVMKGIDIKPSPVWLQSYLSRVGVRPINNVVDITNYHMLLTAQPLHAYDYDKLAGSLEVRMAKENEELSILGGKKLKLSKDNIVIASGDKAVGLGGIMGGADTEVDENTKNIVLECGTFDMNFIRRTAMQFGLFTDAATRFTKGQSPLQNLAVLSKAVEDIKNIAGGQVASQLFDQKGNLPQAANVNTSAEFINSRLGLGLSAEEMKKLLKNVEFEVILDNDHISVIAPFWRTDIEISEDIVEEVGRLYGYDHLPMVLPTRDLIPAKVDTLLSFKAQLREILSSAGANEVLTYSFVHGSLLQKVGQPADLAYQLRNAQSPDLQYYRLSVAPSLLEKVHPNIKLGYDKFTLFELGKGHNKTHPTEGEEKVPKEFNMLALVTAASDKAVAKDSGAAFYHAKACLDFLAQQLGVTFKYEPLTQSPDYPVAKPYDFERSAAVSVAETGAGVGIIGEFRAEVNAGLKLPKFCAGFEIGVEELLAGLPTGSTYKALPRFPKVDQDITLKVSSDQSYGQVYKELGAELRGAAPSNCLVEVNALDIYQKDDKSKHLTFRLSISSYERTLTAQEVNKLLDQVGDKLKTKINAERI